MSFQDQEFIKETRNTQKEADKIINTLNLAEIINRAYIGSQAVEKGKTNNNARQFSNWRKQKLKELYDILGIKVKQELVWDRLGRKSRKFN